jgi:Fur family transcriptional regulator, ferric uptake regulator
MKETTTDWRAALKNVDLKVTPGRLSILTVLENNSKPLSVKEISAKLGKESVDLATLYRTVNSLVEKRLIRQIDFKQDFSYYELAKDKHHHHHLVCVNCSRIADLESCDLPKIEKQNLKKYGFAKIDEHVLEFFGLCMDCENKKR